MFSGIIQSVGKITSFKGNLLVVEAPEIAKNYYALKPDAKLRDVVIAVREDERGHAQENHRMADVIQNDR